MVFDDLVVVVVKDTISVTGLMDEGVGIVAIEFGGHEVRRGER